jgi:beta-mannosidase
MDTELVIKTMANRQFTRQSIDTGWAFKQADSDEPFRSVSQFPTVNHLDLMHHGLSPDPTKDLNSRQVQWVGEREWIYKTTFDFAAGTPTGPAHEPAHHVLVFEGLDTHCRISINGEQLVRTDNMYLEWRVDVTDKIRSGPNELELLFESTFLVGKVRDVQTWRP